MVSELWFLMIKENVRRIHFELPCRHGRRQLLGHYLLLPPLTETVYHNFLKKGPTKSVARYGSADVGFLHDHDDTPPHLLLTNFIVVISWFLQFGNSLPACFRKNG